jgi:hypothetical protein
VSSAAHRPRGLFAFEYYLPMFYSKPITGLTVYMRWKRLFLFVRLNILNGQPECDRRCEGSQSNRKTGILRAFTEIAQKPRGRIICTRPSICANGSRYWSRPSRRRQTGIAHVTTGHQRSTGTAGIADISAANGAFHMLGSPRTNGRRFVMKNRIITAAFARSLFGITRSAS